MMKTKEIKNEIVRKVIKTALQNKFVVTVANVKDTYIETYGTAFRIRKGKMLGWDILAVLAKYMNSSTKDLLGNQIESNNPHFFVLKDSLIVTDPNN